jgi:hypothetical protein
MSALKDRSFTISFLKSTLWILAFASISGCWLVDIDREDQKKPGKRKLLDRSREMIIERVDQRSSVYLRFYTTDLAYCKITLWPKYLGDKPTAENSETIKCDYSGPTDQHLVRIERLKNFDPYYFKIDVGYSKEVGSSGDVIVLEETADNYSFFPPPGYEKLNNEPHTATVIRANLPLGSAKIHSKKTSVTFKNSEAKNFMTITEGCKIGIRKSHTPFLPPTKSDLNNLSASGNIIATSRKIEDRFDTFALDFSEIVPSKKDVSFNISFAGATSKINADAPAYFNYLKLRSGNNKEISLAKPNLTVDSGNFSLTKDADLALLWDHTNKNENDFISVLIGRNSLGPSLKCIFNASNGSAIITRDHLKSLLNDSQDLLVTLNSKQVLNNAENHTLFFHAQDWRQKMIDFNGSQ